MFTLSNLTGHFRTITAHKLLVMKYCFRIGLYRQGLLHDLSKYTPSEFIPGVVYYQGFRSPNDMERQENGYSAAWMHHKGRNKHHLEYWTDYKIGGTRGCMYPVRMPMKYVLEMFCDRIAASKIYNKEKYTDDTPLAYFKKGQKYTALDPETADFLELLLTHLAEHGEAETFRWVKEYRRTHKDY